MTNPKLYDMAQRYVRGLTIPADGLGVHKCEGIPSHEYRARIEREFGREEADRVIRLFILAWEGK